MAFLPSFLQAPSSPFEPPFFLRTLFLHPLTSFFTYLHYVSLFLRGPSYRPPPNRPPITVVTISDTHSKIPPSVLPKGDILIHAGDLTTTGTRGSIQQTIDYLKSQLKPWPGSRDGFACIVVVAGNHDSYFDERSRSAHDRKNAKRELSWGDGRIVYLQHMSATLTFEGGRKLKIYGAPQIPKCGGKDFAFQYVRGQDAWSNTIPEDVDILVTHNPPKWHLDIPENGGVGDEFELKECWRVKPTLHVFGHVHAGHGRENVWWDEGQRAFEAMRERAFGKQTSILGPIAELLDFPLWAIFAKMIYHDVRGLLWTRFWGGARNGGIMVNSALTYRSTDRLLNKPHVIQL